MFNKILINISLTEIFLYGGIALMAVAVFFAAVCLVVFIHSGKKLKKKLKEDYGENG